MEQGVLTEAVSAYQKMIDLKPDLHSYSRAAHLRWLKGDVEGAMELMKMAAQASSPLDPESAAWTHSRVAFYLFQTGGRAEAARWLEAALKFQPDYPAALLLRGRIELADGKTPAAIEILSKACELNPLPEYQWLLADALAAAGRNAEVRELESRLEKRGASDDPRTFALFLATRDRQTVKALDLAREEIKTRADVFTHDALAWALVRSGEIDAARDEMPLALSEGTRDGRLFFHAAVIAFEAGQNAEAADWQQKAEALQQMLFPSERQQLNQMKSRLAARTGSDSVTAKLTAP